MNIKKQIETEIYKRCNTLLSQQEVDGTWRYCFENSVITDAYMLILLRTIDYKKESLIKRMAERILSKQSQDGLWRLYPDEEPANLSATIQAYTALLYAQSHTEEQLQTAKHFIINNGGFKNADLLTKVFLAMNGLYHWPDLPIDPAILFSLPPTSPINRYDISSYARAHFAPVMLMIEDKKKLTSRYTPDLSGSELLGKIDQESNIEDWINLFSMLNMRDSYNSTKKENILSYIQNHIEPDGTLLSYGLTTIFMVYGLLSNGIDQSSSIIQNALGGLMKMFCEVDGTLHLQNSPSTTWDTSLILYTLLEAGVPPTHAHLLKGARFLLSQQQYKQGDWTVHNPDALPGGWGFSIGNTQHPDLDDTQVALRTIARYCRTSSSFYSSYEKGMLWLLSMQNDDGGWAAFEKNTNRYLIGSLPIKHAKDALIDPSTPDLTGRTLEFLGSYHGLNQDHHSIKKAVSWLLSHQETNGSWYGRWGVCYIYGTWASVTGLRSCGVRSKERALQKAKKWLLSIQNEDGGWGESCKSDSKRTYIRLNTSTPSQTAWALNALTSLNDQPTSEMERAVSWLLSKQEQASYPTGAGLPGAFYIRYHSYDNIWPLLALSHYYKKYY